MAMWPDMGRGLKEIVDACGGADEAYGLLMNIPALADKAAEAISNSKIDKIVMWGGANGNNNQAGAGVSALVSDLVGALPPALHAMLNIGWRQGRGWLGQDRRRRRAGEMPNV